MTIAATSTPALAFRDALVECGGLITRDDALMVRTINAGARTVDFIASTAARDSYGDIIDQESWQLDHYKANPIVLYGHASRDLPIGQAVYCAVENGQLVCQIKFASEDANPMAEKVWRLLQEKVLRAVSVGFSPVNGRYETLDGAEVFVWRNSILKEISVVPVPANHEAVARMKSLLAADGKQVTEPAKRAPNPNAPAR